MFEDLDEHLRELTEHENSRFQILQSLTGRELERIYQTDERFIWNDDNMTNGYTVDYDSAWKRSQVSLVRNKRFIHCKKHRHSYIELQYVYCGTLKNVIEDRVVEVTAGEMLLMDTSVNHEVLPAAESDIGINIVMHREFFDEKFRQMLSQNDFISQLVVDSLYAKKKDKKYVLFHCSKDDRIQLSVKMILEEWRLKESGYDTAIQGYLLTVFANLMRNYGEKNAIVSNSKIKQTFVQELTTYLSQNYAGADLKSTSEYFNFNPDYLSRMLKKQVGVSFVTFLQDIRLQQSCIMLSNTELSIDEIAYQIGYSDVSYFHRLFRKRYQKTPADFRRCSQ